MFNSHLNLLSLYRDPIAWSDDRQILGEEINVFTNDSTIDSVYIERQALIVQSLPDSALFNQVAGNLMQAYFRNGDIYQTRVDGNAILVNFPMEKDSTFLYQNYCEAAKLRVDVLDKKMQRFWAGPNPIAKTYPIGMAPPEHNRLTNFAWFDNIRPRGPEDLFEWRPKSAETRLKEMPRRNAPLQSLHLQTAANDSTQLKMENAQPKSSKVANSETKATTSQAKTTASQAKVTASQTKATTSQAKVTTSQTKEAQETKKTKATKATKAAK